ncbi:uncharacterized membrane protein YbaN (DUF454 family) [Sinorhizobium fredii]|uniref:Putative transmembrane protein n=1 Tax=Sinorhizobium fredii (strain USDA 257) TaxID=1185652 RepID=I3X928_SINF2|nr:YbaN family protein [Sinorhizobium fredii]AFL52384.1 putative transmembrane protein [Sinorhizobium fredii USDA 257]
MNLSMRVVLLGLGWAMVGLGSVGIFLPLLPTTTRSSPNLEKWLFDHPVFGQPLRDWREAGAISRGPKICAISLMATGFAYFLFRSGPSPMVAAVVAAIVLAVGVFIVSRPELRK